VYSQFDSKADLFLALLERRIEERAAENARLAASTTSVVGLIDAARRTSEAEPAWNLLLLEFRVHAARIPEVNARYAALHERTKQRLAAALRAASGDAIARSDVPPETMAAFVLAFAAGVSLEELIAPLALAQDEPIRRMVTRALGVADDRRSPAISRGRAPRAAARGRRAR
jgi:AcrR family transcriptional regulator